MVCDKKEELYVLINNNKYYVEELGFKGLNEMQATKYSFTDANKKKKKTQKKVFGNILIKKVL